MANTAPSQAVPDHAFVVAAYGDSPFLAGSLASLREQTLASTIAVATSTPSPYIEAAARSAMALLAVNPRREGIAADWNFALAATRARFVTLAHQDDVYRPAFAERSLALLAATPDAALAFTGYEEIDDAGSTVRSRLSLVKHTLEAVMLGGAAAPSRARMRGFLSLGNPLPCSSVTIDRARLPDFAFSDAFRSNLDWDAWLRLNEAGVVFVRTPEQLVGRRHNPLTATSDLIRSGMRQSEDRRMFRRLWPAPLAAIIAFIYQAGYGPARTSARSP